MRTMLIEILGLLCVGWTTLEVTRLLLRGRSADRRPPRNLGAWDGAGEAIHVELVD